jgi:L-seryl-tRNA(Ser) seleniumtransferase
MRVDKLTLAALEATLTGPPTPVAQALATTPDALRARARRIVEALLGAVDASDVGSEAAVGGGGAPEVVIPSAAVAVSERLAAPLRLGAPAVMGRVEHGRLLLDLLAVPPEDDDTLVEAVRRAAAGQERS